MFKATKVDIKLIEPEVTYKAGVDVMMMRAPWSGSKLCQQYGSSLHYRSLEADSFVVTWI
jgi:hypothetical protein